VGVLEVVKLSDYRRAVIEVVRSAGRPLTFNELLSGVERLLASRVNRFLLRRAVAELVREGAIIRLADHERRVMVFAVPHGES
jgi:Fe2+ or Zn2+ uptake regulation protein